MRFLIICAHFLNIRLAESLKEGTVYKDEPMEPKWWVGLADYSDKHIKEKGLHEAECQRDLDGGPRYVERTSEPVVVNFLPSQWAAYSLYIFGFVSAVCT